MLLPPYVTSALAPIHRAGWPFIAGGLVLSLVLGLLWTPLFWLGLLVTAWVTYFFRDPARVTPEGEGIVVSPADGVVQAIAPRRPPPELELGDAPLTCISVFLNILDVHVNRAPVGGRITRLVYHPGKFLNAADDKASEEQRAAVVPARSDDGQVVGLVQIAGLDRAAHRAVRRAGRGGPCGASGSA